MDAEPGWRAEQIARGFVRGLEAEIADARVRDEVATALTAAVTSAVGALRSEGGAALASDAARSATRGALLEVRSQLGDDGGGPLTAGLCASASRIVGAGARGLATSFSVLATVFVIGLAIGLTRRG